MEMVILPMQYHKPRKGQISYIATAASPVSAIHDTLSVCVDAKYQRR